MVRHYRRMRYLEGSPDRSVLVREVEIECNVMLNCVVCQVSDV